MAVFAAIAFIALATTLSLVDDERPSRATWPLRGTIAPDPYLPAAAKRA